MKLHSPLLERRLRKATRQAIRASSSLRREARQRRRARAGGTSIGGGLLRLMASALLVGVMAVGTVHDVSFNYKLAIVALWGAVTIAFQAGGLTSHLYGGAAISPLILLPVSDQFIFRWQTQIFLWKNLAVWIDCTSLSLLLRLARMAGSRSPSRHSRRF